MLDNCKVFTKQEAHVETQSFNETRTSEFNQVDKWRQVEIQNIQDCTREIQEETNKWTQRLEVENQNMQQKTKHYNDFVIARSSSNSVSTSNSDWKEKLDNDRFKKTEDLRSWFSREQTKIIMEHNAKLQQSPAGSSDEKTWLESWKEKNEPAHRQLLADLNPQYAIEHVSKTHQIKEEMLIKREHLVSSIETRVTTTLTSFTDKLGLEKSQQTTQEELRNLHAIKKHEELLKKLRERIVGLKSTPSRVKTLYEKIMEKETNELNQAFKNKVKDAKEKYESQKEIFKEIKEKLSKIPETIKSQTDTQKEEFQTKKVCKKEVFGFSREVKRFRCVVVTDESKLNSKEVCEENKLVDGIIKCVSFKKVFQAEACEQWTISENKETICVKKALVWPKFTCVEHIKHNGEDVCSRMVFYKPRFVCEKYEIIDNKTHCLKQQTFFGKAYNTYVCTKTGQVIQREVVTEGFVLAKSESPSVKPCTICTDYIKKNEDLEAMFEDLDLKELFNEVTGGRRLEVENPVRSVFDVLQEKILLGDNNLQRRDSEILRECIHQNNLEITV